ncbi:MAG: membrane protein insertion efficiency factor YidD [Alphaproteobacteria bacterium]
MKNSPLAYVFKGLIWIYQATISPFLGPNCRYTPTCSSYAMEAIETHGALYGGWLGFKRIMRCHPITWLGGSSGFDPVPPPRHKDAPDGH